MDIGDERDEESKELSVIQESRWNNRRMSEESIGLGNHPPIADMPVELPRDRNIIIKGPPSTHDNKRLHKRVRYSINDKTYHKSMPMMSEERLQSS